MQGEISVLMSVYKNDKVEEVKIAIESIIKQTLLPKEFIIVVDGEISQELQRLLQAYKQFKDFDIVIHPLKKNQGLAAALNAGLKICKYRYVARMDSDDYSVPDRLEEQLKYMMEHKIDIVCALQEEFIGDINNIVSIKMTPEEHNMIKEKLLLRNVISHPSIMLKKDIFINVGGYNETVGLQEDYDLHMRLIQNYKYGCVQIPLIRVRISNEQRKRRGGVKNLLNSIRMRFFWYRKGYIGFQYFLKGAILFSIFSILPISIKEYLYRFVRKNY